jgi:hypothetical protein
MTQRFYSKRLIQTGLLLLILSLLTSCAEGSAHITVHRNGQADMSIDLAVSDKTLEMIGKPDLMNDLAERLQVKDMKTKVYSRNGESGLSATRSFTLNGAKDQASQMWPEGIQINQTSTKKFLYTEQHMMVSFDLEKLMQQEDSGQLFSSISSPVKNLLQNQLQLEFLFTLPIKPGDSNANELRDNGRTLVWDLNLFEPNQYNVTLNLPNVRNIALTAGAALLFVLVLAWTGLRILRKRRAGH